MSPVLLGRQEEVIVEDDNNDWWFSPTAYIVKWSIFGGFVLIFFVWFVGGYFHAKRRVRKGLQPLWYHRFLVPSNQRPQPAGPQNQFSFYRVEDNPYNMNNMPAAYNANSEFPATYPGEGKPPINPDQSYEVPPLVAELPPRKPKTTGWAKKINPFHK